MNSRNTSSISISSFIQRGKLFFITILSLILIITACKKEADVIGLELQPESEILNAVFTDTSTIITYPLREDSVRTDNRIMLFNNLLGSYTDPVFGLNTADLYSQFRLTTSNVSFGNNPQLDSIVLSMAYAGYYGDTSTTQTLTVYKLTETINADSNYYSTSEFAIDNNPVGTLTFQPKPNTNILIDTNSVVPHIRVKLDNSIGEEILSTSPSNLLNNDTWLQFFPGLFINSEDVLSGGAILSINHASPQSKLSVYYSNDDTAGVFYDFIIGSQSARVNSYTHNYTQIPFGDSIQGGAVTYIQSMGGVKTRIKMPHLEDLKEAGPISINKAELIIKIVDGSDAVFAPHDRLVLLASDSLDRNVVLPDQLSSVTSAFFGGEYNPATKEYKFNIPRYAQQIVNGTRENYGLFLLASGAAASPNRTIIYGGSEQPGMMHMKLRIIYTRIQ